MTAETEAHLAIDVATLCTEFRSLSVDVAALRHDVRSLNKAMVGDTGTNGISSRVRGLERDAQAVKKLLWSLVLTVAGTVATVGTLAIVNRGHASQEVVK